MLPSIQLASPSVLNTEPYNPDQIVVVMGQLLSSFSKFSQLTEFLLLQISNADLDMREVASVLEALVARQSQTGGPVTAELIKAAIKEGTSLAALFGSDPENLGMNLEQARTLEQAIREAGMAVEDNLLYPVIVISSDQNNKQEERLMWMSEAERLSLDVYPVTEEKDYAPYLARSKKEEGRVTRYVFLDDQANLRISSDVLDFTISQANELLSQKNIALNAGRLRLSSELEGTGLLLDWLLDAISASLNNNFQTLDSRRKKMAEDAEEERLRFIQLARLRSDLDRLSEENRFHTNSLGEK